MEYNSRTLESFDEDIQSLEMMTEGLGHRVAEKHNDRSLLAFQAEWHIRGILYHLRRLFQLHSDFVHQVCLRVGTGATTIIMYAPSYQQMLFEFYAVVNLSRISLDNLRVYLAPLFTKQSNQLPKSVRDVLKGVSDCPVYNALTGVETIDYLLDIRNCLVHYRSFATSDNAFVLEEGADPHETVDTDEYFAAMARADFRRISDSAVAVNVLLPDRIFEASPKGGKRLAPLTYQQRLSLPSMSLAFAKLAIVSLKGALEALSSIDLPVFTFSAKQS